MSLTHAQYKALQEWLGSPMRRLLNLRRRLERVGAVPGEPFYDQTCASLRELHKLTVDAHYRSCTHGVAKPGERGR